VPSGIVMSGPIRRGVAKNSTPTKPVSTLPAKFKESDSRV
jgi:hypothetical protein